MHTSTRFFSVVAALAALPFALAQNLTGTWSSGAGNVMTGNGFADPATVSFGYPNTTGISYSFTEDGYYEIARYRFVSNATQPNCVVGIMNWCHGTYESLSNGSLVLIPFGDGYQQIQDPCAAQSNFVQNYNDTELYQWFQITSYEGDGTQLRLYQFDGSPLPPQTLTYSTPNMLPTRLLRNVSTPANPLTVQARSVAEENSAQRLLVGTSISAATVGMVLLSGLI